MVPLGIYLPWIPVVLRFVLVTVGAVLAVNSIAFAASRKVAFRVDATGVTFGGYPIRYQATTRVIPWGEVERVVLWWRDLPFNARARYVSVVRRNEAPPLSAGGTGLADLPAGFFAPDSEALSPDFTAGATRRMVAFRIDDDLLVAAMRACAPSVPLVHLG